MEKNLQDIISEALGKARTEASTREMSITITKLQEAMMWNNEHHKALISKARQSGVGFNPNANAPMPTPTAPPQESTADQSPSV